MLVGGVLFLAALRYAPSSDARRAWKDKAIAEISSRTTNSAQIDAELVQFKAIGTNDPDDSDGWLSPRLILMKNGDWFAYANICQKENHRIRDLFLGCGSDGRWYYSTYHFCKDVIVLKMEGQPEDLAKFAATFYLRPFDGHSEECLQRTWPPHTQ